MLIFSFDYPPLSGGISRLALDAACGFVERGVAVDVMTQGMATGEPAPEVPLVTRLALRRPSREVGALKMLWQRRKQGPVLCGLWYPEGLLATLAGARPRIVLTHGGELFVNGLGARAALWRRLRDRVLRSADLVVANSDYTRQLLRTEVPGATSVTVHPGVDHRRFRPGDRRRARQRLGVDGKLVISTVARLRRFKGHEVVFRALASLPESSRRNFRYLVAGEGPDRPALERMARRLGVARRVRFLGRVPEEELPDLYRASDLFALCSSELPARRETEGFGLALLEAQASGVPVVGSRSGGIPEAVGRQGGWLIDEGDSRALAALLRRLLSEPATFRGAGRAARKRIERSFTRDHYLRRLEGALEGGGIRLA